MKTEKQIHPINMRQYRSRRIIRIVLRCFGIYLAGSALFAAAFQIGNRAVAESRVGILIWLVCSFLCGGILLTLSFFVPKLPRYRETIAAGSPVCAGCSTRLSDLKDTEILIADGKRYCDVCAKRYMEGDLKKPVQEPVYKREQTYTCARCKKQIGEQDCVWIGNHRFCRDCTNTANQIILKAERYKEPKYREPIGPTGLCSRCRSRVPLTELVFKDLTDCICRSCYQKIKRFPILHLYFNPCMQYDACETLDVCVVKDGYVVNYEESHGSNHYFVIPTGFFANASWDAIAAILNAASPSGRGFGFGKTKRLSADDIKNNEAVQKLIQYDDDRKKHMRFSGGEHGDTVDLRIQPDGTVMVNCSNDGEGNRMAAGGYSRPMPEELVHNYDQSRFIVWLQAKGQEAFLLMSGDELLGAFLNKRSEAEPMTEQSVPTAAAAEETPAEVIPAVKETSAEKVIPAAKKTPGAKETSTDDPAMAMIKKILADGGIPTDDQLHEAGILRLETMDPGKRKTYEDDINELKELQSSGSYSEMTPAMRGSMTDLIYRSMRHKQGDRFADLNQIESTLMKEEGLSRQEIKGRKKNEVSIFPKAVWIPLLVALAVGIGGAVAAAWIERETGAELGFVKVIASSMTGVCSFTVAGRWLSTLRARSNFRKLKKAYGNPAYWDERIEMETFKELEARMKQDEEQ